LVVPLQQALLRAIPRVRVDVKQLDTGTPIKFPVSIRLTGEDAPTLRRLAAGDYFGETVLLVDLLAAATITTLEPFVFLGLHPQSSPSSSRRRLHFAGSLRMHWISE
jgi:hypothetical protein